MSNGETHPIRKSVIAATIALAAVGAYKVAQSECVSIGDVLHGDVGNIISCAGTPGESHAAISDLPLKSQKLTGTAVVMTFGELTMKIGGTAKVDYNPRQWYNNNPLGTDQTLFYNRGDRGVQTVVANPCIKFGDDYKDSFNSNPKTVKSPTSTPTDIPKASVNWEILPNPDASIKEVAIDAGILDLCFARIPNSRESEQLWSINDSLLNHSAVSDEVQATTRWAVQELVLKAALAQGCPENEIDMSAIKKSIATVVLGSMSAQKPENATVYAAAFAQGKFKVTIADPSVRQGIHKKQFDTTRREILAIRNSFPDENGKRNKTRFDTVGSFPTKSCSSKEISVKPA